MDEVIQQLYENHRQSLVYKRRQVQEKKPTGRKVKSIDRENAADALARFYGRSLDLDERKVQKAVMREKTSHRYHRALSKKEHQPQKSTIEVSENVDSYKLPKIHHNSEAKSASTRIEENSQYTTNSFQSRKKQNMISTRKPKIVSSRKIDVQKVRKWRKCTHAIIFSIRLKKQLIEKEDRFKKTIKHSQNLLKIIDKMVNKYYVDVLREPLLGFQRIMQEKVNDKKFNASEHIVMNIIDFSQKLKDSSIRRDLVEFLTLITLHNAYIPADYFSDFELQRLGFHSHSIQIARVSDLQLKMIVTVFMSIKLLSNYVFYQPWNVRLFQLDSKSNQKRLGSIMWAYGSFFYWFAIKQFENLPHKNKKYLQRLIKRGFQPVSLLEESNDFYETVKSNHPKKFHKICANLKDWLGRIVAAIYKYQQNYIFSS